MELRSNYRSSEDEPLSGIPLAWYSEHLMDTRAWVTRRDWPYEPTPVEVQRVDGALRLTWREKDGRALTEDAAEPWREILIRPTDVPPAKYRLLVALFQERLKSSQPIYAQCADAAEQAIQLEIAKEAKKQAEMARTMRVERALKLVVLLAGIVCAFAIAMFMQSLSD
jgi:predicted secreted protein